MRFLNVVLSSYQIPGYPNFLNHYIFVDPIDGTNITYPNTANGDLFTTTSYVSAVTGGLIFPWGYTVQNTTSFINLGVLKGPYTITFNPSAIDNTFYTTLKIMYDFGDGTEIYTVEKDVVIDYTKINLSELTNTADAGNPKVVKVNHEYWPKKQSLTTYTATITVVNGNFVNNVFYIYLSSVHDSIYDLNEIHMLNKLDLDSQAKNNLLVLEYDNDETSISNLKLTR